MAEFVGLFPVRAPVVPFGVCDVGIEQFGHQKRTRVHRGFAGRRNGEFQFQAGFRRERFGRSVEAG